MSRVSLRERQAVSPPKGRAALLPPEVKADDRSDGRDHVADGAHIPLTEDRIRSTDDGRRFLSEHSSGGRSWEATHRRVTFYCPVALLVRIEAEVVRSGRSKSQVIVGAIVSQVGLSS